MNKKLSQKYFDVSFILLEGIGFFIVGILLIIYRGLIFQFLSYSIFMLFSGFALIQALKNMFERSKKEAIENTKALLIKNKDNINLPLENISFIHDSHENIDNYIQTKIDIAIFNLGYLPGGDHKFTTKDDTTLKTMDKILNNLNINGYVAIVMYPGHEEGLKEYQSIKLFVKDLPKKSFTVGWYKMINHNFNAPALCWIEKVGEYA